MEDQAAPRCDVAAIDAAMGQFMKSLSEGGVKMIVADALRLLELRKEIAQEEIREVRVEWVESNPAPFARRT